MINTPMFQDFDPRKIQWQWEANEFERSFDFSTGILEEFFSGGVGSAKTIKHIHNIVRNCLEQPNSRWLMVRRTLKDLKRTSWMELLRHMADIPYVVKSYNKTDRLIVFKNGSEILGDSYDDGDLTKFQSLPLSGLDIEEANEMSKEIYEAIKLRVGRAGVFKNIIQARCNPDSPAHWLHSYFIDDDKHPNKKVFYSITEQNPFLPSWYVENLKRDLDPKMARRKLYGEWIDISTAQVYYSYEKSRNYRDVFTPDYNKTLLISHDFNIGKNKPMSAVASIKIGDTYHVFKAFHIDGARTLDIMEAIASFGLFDRFSTVHVYGDASGKHNDTRSLKNDYEIIEKFLANYIRKDGRRLKYELKVPRSNPPIRRRHNLLNAHFLNENNETRLFVYDKWLDEGFRLTSFKKNGDIVEDDTLAQQHATTAVGYMIDYDLNRETGESRTIQL